MYLLSLVSSHLFFVGNLGLDDMDLERETSFSLQLLSFRVSNCVRYFVINCIMDVVTYLGSFVTHLTSYEFASHELSEIDENRNSIRDC